MYYCEICEIKLKRKGSHDLSNLHTVNLISAVNHKQCAKCKKYNIEKTVDNENRRLCMDCFLVKVNKKYCICGKIHDIKYSSCYTCCKKQYNLHRYLFLDSDSESDEGI